MKPALVAMAMPTYVICANPTQRQHAHFADHLGHTRHLYNAALEERNDCHRKGNASGATAGLWWR
jgi:Helix-turn-helix domain